MNPTLARRTLSLFAIATIIICAIFLLRGQTGLDESDVQRTDGIEITTILIQQSSRGFSTSSTLHNQTDRLARSVVFTVRIHDASGKIIASNPLGNTLNLMPGEQRVVGLWIPIQSTPPPDCRASSSIELVRWDD